MQRYTVKGWDGVAVQSDDGEFVRWDDVEARDVERLAECVAKLDREAALTAERDALRARVAELEAPPVVVQCARRVVEAWDACDREAARESQSSAPMVRYIEAQSALRRAVAALAEPHVAADAPHAGDEVTP